MSPVATYTYAGQYNPNVPVLPDAALAVLPGRFVAVRKVSDGQLATIYTTRTKSAATVNPVQIDEDGNLSFFADPGQYTLHLVLVGGAEGVGEPITVPIDPVEAGTDADIAVISAALAIVQAAQATADAAITALQARARHGTWDEMMDAAPTDDHVWFTTDQELFYVGTGIKWRRVTDPLETWVTDYGAVPNDDASFADLNDAAFAAATDDVRVATTSTTGYDQHPYVLIVPSTPVGCIYHISVKLNVEQIHMEGRGAGLADAHLGGWSYKPSINGRAIASPDPMFVLDRSSGGGTMNDTVIKNLNLLGNCTAVKGKAASGDNAGLSLLNVDIYSDDIEHADNSNVLLEGFFWFNWFTGAGRIGGTPNFKPMVLMRSINTSTRSTYLCQFRDLVCTYALPFLFECNQTVALGQINGDIAIHNVVSEQQAISAPFFKATSAASSTPNQTLGRVSITGCRRDDAPGQGGSFVEFAGHAAAPITVTAFHLANNSCQTNYVMKATNTDISQLHAFGNTDRAFNAFFDPASSGYGVNSTTIHGRSLDFIDGQTYNSAAASASGGSRYFRGGVVANAWFGIDSLGRALRFGPDDGAADTLLQRISAGVLGVGADDCFRTGVDTTPGRPNAATVGEGAQFYDKTLHKPIWSDGAAWRDAMANVV